jgi:hypothetical protein
MYSGGVCDDENDPEDETACRTIFFLTRFIGVYFFLVACVLASLMRATFTMFPDNDAVSAVASLSLMSWVPTSVIAACMYVDISVASSSAGTLPPIPPWVIIITNAPFTLAIAYVNYWERKRKGETKLFKIAAVESGESRERDIGVRVQTQAGLD